MLDMFEFQIQTYLTLTNVKSDFLIGEFGLWHNSGSTGEEVVQETTQDTPFLSGQIRIMLLTDMLLNSAWLDFMIKFIFVHFTPFQNTLTLQEIDCCVCGITMQCNTFQSVVRYYTLWHCLMKSFVGHLFKELVYLIWCNYNEFITISLLLNDLSFTDLWTFGVCTCLSILWSILSGLTAGVAGRGERHCGMPSFPKTMEDLSVTW